MTRPTMTDVTDKWEAKTRGGDEVVRVEVVQDSLIAIVVRNGSCRPLIFWLDGKVSKAGDTSGDLIPKKPPRTPLERILPFVDHWWRSRQTGLIGKLTLIDPSGGMIRCESSQTTFEALIERYEHAVAIPDTKPEDWKWEKVPE